MRFHLNGSTIDRAIFIKEKSEDFYFPLAAAPKLVRIDPELTLLAKVKFNWPEAMIAAQLEEKGDVVGRLLAIEQLAGKKTRATVTQLQKVLQSDPFYGVRIEAARALAVAHRGSLRRTGRLAQSVRCPGPAPGGALGRRVFISRKLMTCCSGRRRASAIRRS